MSTKIYTGFRLPIIPIKKLHAAVNELRKVCSEYANKEIARVAFRMMVERADERILGTAPEDDNLTRSPFGIVSMDLLNRAAKVKFAGAQRDWEIDFNFDFCLFPQGGHYLGMYFGERQFFVDALYRIIPGAHEYHYQNSTDRPDEISQRKWTKRRKDWDAALPGCSAPIDAGFSYTITNPKGFVTVSDLSDDLCPPFEDRVKSLARLLATNRRMQEEIQASPETNKPSTVIRINRWLREDEEGKAYLQAVRDEIIPKLPTTYTVQDLLKKGTTNEA